MITLYDRLEPEILKGLMKNEEKYEAGTRLVIKSLKENHSWLDLTVGQVHNIITFSDISWGKIEDWTFKFGKNIIRDER